MLLDRLRSTSQELPNRVAVVAGDERLTYGQLEDRSNRCAGYLSEQGLARGSLVAVYGRRSVDAAAALFGIMKSGAAYTVVEDDGQAEEHSRRLRTMAPAFVLCEEAQAEALRAKGLRAASMASALESEPCPELPSIGGDDTAYVLFTSGSTGKPKGVAVSHDNITHYTTSLIARLGVEPGLRYGHVSTLAADLGNTCLFLAWWSGGCLHLIDGHTRRDPAALRGYLVRHQVEFLKITPSHWNAVFAALGGQQSERIRLKYLLLGGEALSVAVARKILEAGCTERLVNHYGPTETTVGVTVFPIQSLAQLDALEGDTVPIGLPLGDTILRVRTDDGTFHERGVHGELYIGGPSVAIGYVGDEAATQRSFVSLTASGDEP